MSSPVAWLKSTVWWTASLVAPNKVAKYRTGRTYDKVATEIPDEMWPFLNYGYVPLGGEEPIPELEPPDRPFHSCIELYHRVASQVDLEGVDVLEVGSGRGGGASYVKRYLKPKSVIGVDLSSRNVARCKQTIRLPGLSFRKGDAEALPFDDNRFDAVINVESSHHYPDVDRFFRQVKRVLKPGGHFLYTDHGDRARMKEVEEKLRASGLRVLRSRDVTANVIESLKLRSAAVEANLKKTTRDDKEYRKLARWARVEGSDTYEKFREDQAYVIYLLEKPAPVRTDD